MVKEVLGNVNILKVSLYTTLMWLVSKCDWLRIGHNLLNDCVEFHPIEFSFSTLKLAKLTSSYTPSIPLIAKSWNLMIM